MFSRAPIGPLLRTRKHAVSVANLTGEFIDAFDTGAESLDPGQTISGRNGQGGIGREMEDSGRRPPGAHSDRVASETEPQYHHSGKDREHHRHRQDEEHQGHEHRHLLLARGFEQPPLALLARILRLSAQYLD